LALRANLVIRGNEVSTQCCPYLKTGGCDVIASLRSPATCHPELPPAT